MSGLLVFLQFLLITAIAYPSRLPAPDFIGAALFVAGLLVFLAAFLAMRLKNFTVMPEPKAQAELVDRGIYRAIRHPMYLAVLLCAAGACLAYGLAWKWGLSGALALVLWIKLRREEKMLLQRYPAYAAYRQRTKALIPLLI